MNLAEKIKDKWLTWRTGLDKDRRDLRDWCEQNIVFNASYVANYYQGFKYIIAVDFYKVNTKFVPVYGLIESDEFLSYMWPNKPLGQHGMYRIFRGEWNQFGRQFYINDFGYDQMFVATNVEEDAIMITLKWS